MQQQEVEEAGGSAWNSGGTFGERDMTEWAKKQLSDSLVGLTVDCGGGSVVFETTSVDEVEGDASVTFARGKVVIKMTVSLVVYVFVWKRQFNWWCMYLYWGDSFIGGVCICMGGTV